MAFGDGRQTRDYVYVGDVVAANLAAAGTDWAGACNIGTGTETSVIELAAALRAHGDGAPFELEFAPARTGEIVPQRGRSRRWRARCSAGRRASALAEGLERTLAARARLTRAGQGQPGAARRT